MKLENVMAYVKEKPNKTSVSIRSIKLTSEKKERFFEGLPEEIPRLASSLSNLMYHIKVEPAIEKGYVDAKAIRVYLNELNANVNSSRERGEKPYLLVKTIRSEKRGVIEFEIVFMGTRHVEKLSYYKTNPKTWKSWGEIVASPKQIKELKDLFERLLEDEKIKEKESKFQSRRIDSF